MKRYRNKQSNNVIGMLYIVEVGMKNIKTQKKTRKNRKRKKRRRNQFLIWRRFLFLRIRNTLYFPTRG